MTEVKEPDELYALDPSEFVAARNALVKQLRAGGRRDEAAEVAALRRPNAPAHALNRLARERPELIEQALAAGAGLRAATEAALGGDASALRAATADERKATDAAVDAAARILGGSGAAARQQLAATLRAAVLNDEVADQLRRGVLSADHEASAFGFASGFDLGAPPKRARGRKPAATTAADDDARRVAEEAARERRARRKELDARVRSLERVARKLGRAAQDADAEARAARIEADAAALELDAARRELDALDG